MTFFSSAWISLVSLTNPSGGAAFGDDDEVVEAARDVAETETAAPEGCLS